MSDILQLIKKAAVDAVNADNPTQVLFGFVESLEPFAVRVSQTMLITENFMILGSTIRSLWYNNQLSINDRVLIVREQGGQKYLIMDIIPDDAWLPEYLKGDDGKSVEIIVDEYSVNEDVENAPTENWSETIPKWEKGKYLWVRTKIVYSNPIEVVYTDVVCDTAWESISYLCAKIENTQINVDKTAESIRQEVATTYLSYGEFESYKATAIDQTDEKIEFQFNQLKNITDNTNNALQSEISERQKYITFEDGNITLGEQGNKFQTVIDNDSMDFKENGETVAHISNKTLNITDADIEGVLDIGGFRWVKRENGNLSLVKL